MELKENNYYIIAGKRSSASWSSPYKIQVLEVTKTTYYLKNVDTDIKFRIDIEDFSNKYSIREKIDVDLTAFNELIKIMESETLEDFKDLFK